MARASKDVLDIINKRRTFTTKNEKEERKNQAPVNKTSSTAKVSKNETTERKTEIRGKRASQEVIDIINSRNSFARPKSTLPTVEKSTVGGTLPKSSALADINKELSTLTAEFDAKERKYTNEYWQSRLDEETSRLYTLGSVNSPNGVPTTNTGAEAWLLVDEEKNAWETERADLRKKIMDLSSMKKVYEGMSVLSAPDYAEYSAKGAEITPSQFLPDMMTEDEIGAYQYIVAKDGKDKAEEFLDGLDLIIETRKGKRTAENISDIEIPVVEQLATAGYGLYAGAARNIRGIGENFSDKPHRTTASEIASSYISEDLADEGFKIGDKTSAQYLYGGMETVGGMLPSIAVSYLTKGLGTAAGLSAGTAAKVGSVAGNVALGLSASGSAYAQALAEGYDVDQARAYGTLVGASEAGLQAILGGISSLGGVNESKLMTKVAAIDNAFLRVAGTAGLKLGGEITEEELQLFIEPYLRTAILNEEYDAPEAGEMIETALITAISTGLLESGPIISSARSKSAFGQDIISSGDEDIDNTIEAGLESPVGSAAYELAQKLNEQRQKGEDISPNKLGVLADAIVEEAVRNEQPTTLEEAAQARVNDLEAGRMGANSEVSQKVDNLPTETKTTEIGVKETATRNNVQEESTPVAPTIEERIAEAENKTIESAYELGKKNTPREKVTFATPAQEEAYNAGRIEHIKNMPKEEEVDSTPKQAYNVSGKMTDKTKNALDKKRSKYVDTKDGISYISDGVIAIPIEESDVEYAKSEWGAMTYEKTAEFFEKVANEHEYTPISANPIEGTAYGIGSVYLFTTDDGRKIAIQKKYAKYFDGNNLSAAFEKGWPYAIKAMDSNGDFVGVALAVRPTVGDRTYQITNTKEVSMKSFKKKKTVSTKDAPKAKEPSKTAFDAEFDKVIQYGSGFENGKQRIVDFYKSNPSKTDAVGFLKDEYGIGGRTYTFPDGTIGWEDHDSKGIKLSDRNGNSRLFSWSEVDDRLRQLIGNGEYSPNKTREKTTSSVAVSSPTEHVKNRAAEYGIESHVISDAEWEKSGKKYPMYSKNGHIYMRETLDENMVESYVPHEATHVMKQLGFAPYIEFVESLPEKVNMQSKRTQEVLSVVAEHRGLDILDISEDNLIKFYDELAASVYGDYNLDKEKASEFYKDIFYDFESVIKELAELHELFKNERKSKNGQGTEVSKLGRKTDRGSHEGERREDSEGTREGHSDALSLSPRHGIRRGVNAQDKIANDVIKYIEKGKDFSAARLFEIADKAYGGTMAEGAYTVKDAYDGMELAVNRYLMSAEFVKNANGNAKTAVKTVDKLIDLLTHIPTQTKRTEEMESYQQFSTPPNIAYLAAWAANINNADVVLEPSAGIGGLALWGKAWGATVYANELSERRLAFLNELGLDGTFNLNAEQIDNLLPDNIKPSVVVMNPPFSATAGRMNKNDTSNAKRHIEQALERLEPNGRLVAILGNGMANDTPTFKVWWSKLRSEYNVRANVRIDGSNYRKYGTTFDVQLVVIDKTGPNTEQTITGTYKDLSEIPALLEGIRNDRQRTVRQSDAVAVRDTGRDTTRLDRDMGSAAGHTSDVLDGERRASEDSMRTPDGNRARGNNGTNNNRPERNSKAVSKNARSGNDNRVDRSNAGTRIELSGSSNADLDGRAVLEENPDSVYSTYVPRKVHIKGAKKHPARLVESAAMAAVDPPDVTYTPALPASIATSGLLSDAQLENVVYAGQAHEKMLGDGKRKGYFIGDGTGVGKGRQISGIIMDNFLQGREKAVWISAKPGLINDARRDWQDLGGNPDDVIDLSGTKLLKTGVQTDTGILFGSYKTLSDGRNKEKRFELLKNWLGEDFDGVIAFDEAHLMGNSVAMKGKRGKTKPSQQALTGIELQKTFPNARVVYASATGATDISQYGYLERLGLWGKGTAFNDLNDFIEKISSGGLAAMELVARDMKAMGVYMARSISYDEVKYDTLQHDLTPMQTEIYDTMSAAWQKVFQNVNEALEVTGADKNGQARGAAYSAIYGGQQRFYNQILTSMSMPSVIEDIKKELAAGRSCVIQLTNTNESQQNRAIAKNEAEGGTLEDLDLTPSETLVQMVASSFPIQVFEEYMDEDGRIKSRLVVDANGNPVIDKKAVRLRDNLIAELQQMKVPDGPLEMLLDAFGVDQVAEVTGRSRRVVEKADENGVKRRIIENRNPRIAGAADARMFQDGKKRILIFSGAGGTGFSYHADKRAKNQQQRVHYLLQPGWSATEAVQGFGRTHRSNQVSAPIVRLITTNAMGQKRFTSTIARRLDQLGALTKGQRQTGSGVFSEKDNLENPIAADALSVYYKSADRDILKKLGLYDKIFDEYGRLNESAVELRDVSKFLNRILSLEVAEQNEVFQGFYDTFERMMDVAISNGTVDMGLENYRADKIEVIDEKVVRKDETGADTKYVQMKTYKKPEITSYAKLDKSSPKFKGLVRMEDGSVRAVYETSSKTTAKGEIERRFRLESPVKGVSNAFVEKTLNEKTTPIDKSEWKQAWQEEIAKAPEYNEGTLHLLTGTLLPIWNRLPQSNTRVMRVISSDGRQYLGRVIAPSQIDLVLKGLGAGRTMQTYTPHQISEAVLNQGKEVALRDNRQKIVRRRVSNEWRMEITGQNTWYLARQYPNIISERINYEYRYFIPTGEAGTKILEDLIKNNPVVDVREETKTGDIDYMRGAKEADHSDQWTADRVGDKNKKPKSLSEIIEDIRHNFGVNITTGHIRGSDIRGTHEKGTNGIRTKKALDLPTVAHELGHNIDEKYGLRDGITEEMQSELVNQLEDGLKKKYPANKLVGEGIAEYVRKFLQNRETAAIDYPLFTDYFLGSMTGKELALIEQLADEVNAYYALDADTATSSIKLYGEKAPDARTVSEKAKAKTGVLYQAFVDANHGIKRFDLATGANTYKIATNAAYADAIAGNMISGGDLTDANGKYVAPGLLTALHGLDLNNKDEYLLFGEYLTVKHGPERLKEGMRTFSDDRKNSTAWMNNRQAEIERQHPEFVEISERLYSFWDKFMQTWAVNTGLVDKGTYSSWRERWEYYVPFNRVIGQDGVTQGAKRGFANQNSTIKKAHGSGKDIVHPVDNMIVNLVKMVNAGVRNNVMVQITNQAKKLKADASFLEQVPIPLAAKTMDMTEVKEKLTEMLEMGGMNAKDTMIATGFVDSLDDILIQYGRGKAHGDVIFVLKNGQPEAWKINDVGLLKSLTSMSPHTMDGILDAYAVVSRFMTANITGNNLIWSIFSNFPRDMMTLFTYSKSKNPVKVISGVGSAYLNKAKGNHADPFYKEFLALGGGQTSEYTADQKLTRNARKKLARKAGKGLEKVNWNPLDWIGFVGNTVESGPRYATYKICREKGMSPQESFYEAMDITVNFRRGGTVSRELNKVIPFFNANVQGLDKFRRWITIEELAGQANRKKAVTYRAISFIAVSAALGALIYAVNNGDDEKEKEYEQLSNYIKNSYWNIPIGDGKYFAIPKPRELGVLSSFFETCMEYGVGDNDHAFDEFYAYASENFLPAIANDIAQVGSKGVVETGMNIIGSLGVIGVVGYLGANRDFLGRPIVSSGLQNLEPKDQYTDRTSKIAYWVGQATNGSPQQIDYFFQQILGGWWKTQKALFPVGGENIDKTLGVRNTYIKDNQYSTDLTNWLYDRADKTARAKKSNPTDIDKAISAKWDSNMTSFYGTYYKQAKNKSDTTATRGTRQLVLDMILEYQKGIDKNYKTKTQLAVEKVCKEQNSTEFLPSVMPVEVTDGKDKKHTLSDIQYVEYQTDYLRLYWETIEEALPDAQSKAERAQIITSAKRVAKEQATARTLARIGAPASDFTKKYGEVSNDHLVDFFTGIAEANSDNSVKQAEVVNVISSMDVDDTEAWALYLSRYDSKYDVLAEEHGIPAETYMNAKVAMAGMSGKDRRKQIERYLNSVCDSYKEYLFLLGMEYKSIRDDYDYVMFFGEQD